MSWDKARYEELFKNVFHHFSRVVAIALPILAGTFAIFQMIAPKAKQREDWAKGIASAKIGLAAGSLLSDILNQVDAGQSPSINTDLLKQLLDVSKENGEIFFATTTPTPINAKGEQGEDSSH